MKSVHGKTVNILCQGISKIAINRIFNKTRINGPYGPKFQLLRRTASLQSPHLLQHLANTYHSPTLFISPHPSLVLLFPIPYLTFSIPCSQFPIPDSNEQPKSMGWTDGHTNEDLWQTNAHTKIIFGMARQEKIETTTHKHTKLIWLSIYEANLCAKKQLAFVAPGSAPALF